MQKQLAILHMHEQILKFSQTTNLKTSALCIQTWFTWLPCCCGLSSKADNHNIPTNTRKTSCSTSIWLHLFFTRQSPVKMKRTSDNKLTVTSDKVTKLFFYFDIYGVVVIHLSMSISHTSHGASVKCSDVSRLYSKIIFNFSAHM